MRKLFLASIIGLLSVVASAQNWTGSNKIINSGDLRFGNDSELSINNTGNVQQPFYRASNNVWYKLTYSTYPLDFELAAGGDGTTSYNRNGNVLLNPVMTNQVFDQSGFTITSGSTGYGTLKVKGNITVGTALFEVTFTYYVAAVNDNFCKVTTSIKNVGSATATNVRYWVGTRDDYVGVYDSNTKTKGNIVNGAFQQVPTAATQSRALQISNGADAVLFYTTSPLGNMSHASCCSFTNSTGINPASAPVTASGDGSYAMFIRLPDLGVGQTQTFEWYYAAGSLAEIAQVVSQVASASITVDNITSTTAQLNAFSSNTATGSYVVVPAGSTAPSAAEVLAGSSYGSTTVVASGSGALAAGGNTGLNMSGLSPLTNYTVYFVSQYLNGGNMVTSSVTSQEFTTLFACGEIDTRIDGSAGSAQCPGVSGTPYNSSVNGTAYTTAPTSAKTATLRFKWSAATFPSIVPVISSIWINGVSSAMQVGPPSVTTTTAGEYFVEYCLYNINLPTTGSYSVRFINPQTGNEVGVCTYAADNTGASIVTPVLVPNVMPTITTPANITLACSGAATSPVNFTVSDVETASELLVVSATSSNTTLIPNANLIITQPTAAGAGSLAYTIASNQSGSSVITLTVQDVLGGTTTSSFTVTVNSGGASETILVSNSLCGTNTLQWMSLNNVTSTTASGTGQNGITVAITHSAGGMLSNNGMYEPQDFPAQYNVPGSGTPVVQNNLAGDFQACFSQPVVNPVVAFSSVGNPFTPVTVTVSQPYTQVWSGTGTTWTSNTQFIGQEGDNIIRINGTVTCVNFNYGTSETYATIAFGFENQNCYSPNICSGNSVTLTASGAANYVWSPSTGLNTTSGASVIASPTTTTTYTVTNPSNVCATPASVTVVVNPTPVVTVPANTTALTGSVISSQAFTSTVSGTSYTWTNSNTSIGLAGSGSGSVPSFTATNNTSNPVTSTITVTPTSPSLCVGAPVTYTITVEPIPNVNDPADVVNCEGTATTVDFTGTTSNTNYLWTNDNTSIGLGASGANDLSFTTQNLTNVAQVANVTVTPQAYVTEGYVWGSINENGTITLDAPAGKIFTTVAFASYGTPSGAAGNYALGACHAATSTDVITGLAIGNNTITVVANNATFGDPCVTSGKALAVKLGYGISVFGTPQTFSITVNPSATIANSIDTICTGSSFTFATSSSDIVPANTTYTWSVINNSNINGATAQATSSVMISQILYNASSVNQTQTYTVTPSSGTAGCVGAPFAYNVTVTPLPTTISAAGSTSFCQGGDVTLIAPVAPIGMSYAYQWNIDGIAIPGATSISYIASASGSYTVTVTNNAGCSATSLGVVVTENPLPTLVANSGATTVCEGATAVVLNTQVGGVWSSNDITIASVDATTGVVSGAAAGSTSMTYTYTNANGCTSSVTSSFTVNPLPTPVITAAGATTFCQGGSVVLTASAGTSYLWSNGATSASIAVTTSQDLSVVVTNANGCSAASSITSVVVNALPIATISSLNGTSFCQGSAVTLVASSGSSYLWSTGAITQSVTLSATQSVTVTITNANGCTSTSAPFSVTMNSAPSAIVTANGSTTFCDGGSVELSAPSAASYLWSSGETTQSIFASVDGPYTVTVTDANGCSATSSNTNITVLTLPIVQAIAGSNNVCVGSNVALSNATTGGVWSTADASIAAITSGGLVTGIADGQVNLFYTVTNTNGCSVAVSLNMTVNANPVLTAINGASSVCLGSTTTLSNSQLGGTWSSSDVAIANVAANGVVTGLSVGSTTITYTYTNVAGCTSSISHLLTVNALPVATVIANGPTTFCPGGSVTLSATPSMSSYLWSTGAPTPSITTGAVGQYTVTITDANGCSSTSAPTSVNHFAVPVAAIASTGSSACLGSTVTLTASGGATYSWSNGATSASIDVTAANDYTVTVTSIDGCSSTATETVVFNTNPAVTINANGPTVFCQGGSLTLTATGGSVYVWSNGDQGATTTVNQSGTYYVTVTNAAGCTTQSSLVNVTVNATPVVSTITGGNTVCEGSSLSLTSSTIGGVWTSANNFIATIDANGTVTGLNSGSTVMTYTVTNNGCSAAVSAMVTVLNNPVLPIVSASGSTEVCPGSTVVLFASNAANYQWNTGATTPFIVATQSGSYDVTVTGLNGCSATSAPINVFIGDNTNPVITAPLNVTVTPNLGCEAIGVTLGTPVTSDNCGVASVSNNAPAIYPIGTTTVVWTVTDASGNTATASQQVTVVDQTAPTAIAPANVTVASNDNCDATGVQLGMPVVTDNCTNDLVITNNAPTIYPLGTTTVTWTITDAAGNVTTVDQTVTVVDETAPVVLLSNTSVILDENGYNTIDFSNVNNGSYDNCGIASAVLSQSAFDCSNVGDNIISVTVIDNNGNQSTAQVVVTVIASDACGDSNWAGPAVPDAFTPNGNNFNDFWVIPGLEGYNTKEMTVYSRYGTLVHYSSTYNNDWDGTLLNTGTPVPDGTYYYILNLDGGKQLNGYVYINRVKQ